MDEATEVYEMTWDDGSVLTSYSGDVWVGWRRARSGKDRRYSRSQVIMTTRELADMNKSASRGYTYYSSPFHVDIPAVLTSESPLSLGVDPYILGAWVGDGTSASSYRTSSFEDAPHWLASNPECFLVDPNSSCAKIATPGLYSSLNRMGLLGNKHIPAEYKAASTEDRLSLVQGLMDTDGSVAENGICSFSQAANHSDIVNDMAFLLSSLGLKVKRKIRKTAHQDAHILQFTPNADFWYQRVFRMERKIERLRNGVGQWSFTYLRNVELKRDGL